MAATITEDDDGFAPSTRVVRLTTDAITSTYVCPHFAEIVSVVGNNESGDDGVGVGVDGVTITLTVGTAGDVVTLFIVGRK
uniref:Uncharacterized protein n=1 Tax=viral metagenome TaxID=1070528 RepID=A0A6M3L8J4_9ZZZZ